MTSGKQARKRRAQDGEEQPLRRPPAHRVLPPSVAREARHDQNRGMRRGFAFWRSLTPQQRKDIQAEAEAAATAEPEEETK